MNALTAIWTGLDTRRRALLIGGLAALLVIAVILGRVATAPSYGLLYSGLDAAAAGDVVTAVEARGIPYRVQGDAIYVDVAERDALRMSLAGEGLPANGAAGYELLDSLSGFGTTSQMFDAAYWRAREGELARTILSSPHIRAARVHLANPGADPFQPAQEVTASVAIRPAAGGLAPGHAQALRYLVASSVPGLLPENVAVIDADSGQVLGGAEMLSPAADASGRAEEYRRNIERLLAARVGPGNAVVQVSVNLTTAHETIVERLIDPESRVVMATETEDRDNASRDGAAQGVTVASNLPEGDATAGGSDSSAQSTESRERVTFDISETQREIARAPGDIERISVAVLLNGVTEVDADGLARVVPRPAEELAALERLVQSAIGYDAERGDRVTIDSMAFDETATTELTAGSFTDRLSLDLGRVIQTVVLTAAALFIAFGLLRPLLTRGASEPAEAPALAAPPVGGQPLPVPAPPQDAASGASVGPADQARPAPEPAQPGLPDMTRADPDPGLPTLPQLAAAESADLDPVNRLRQLIEEREAETVEILRGWMEEDDGARP